MKKLLVFTTSLIVTVSAFAQGTVNFNNFVSGVLRAPVYNSEVGAPTVFKNGNTSAGIPAESQTYSGALLEGTGFTVQLWGNGRGPADPIGTEASLQLIATTVFRTGTAAGLTLVPATGSIFVVPNAPLVEGERGTFQLRAWDSVASGALATWANVMTSATVKHGKSTVFSPAQALGLTPVTGQPLAPPVNLIGLTSFNLAVVPEPSAIALGVLGLGSLMLLRRRK